MPRTRPSAWGNTSAAERATILNRIADRMEDNLDALAKAETLDNGKPIRETMARRPAAGDRSFPLLRRLHSRAGRLARREIDDDTVAYHFHEPLGVVGQIIPWNFPILMAVWKLAPALAAGNCVVLKPAEQTPASILVLVRTDRRPAAARRDQYRQRLRRRSRQAARLQQAHRQDRLHRRDHHRPADHAIRVAEPDSGDAGTRRQVAEHLLCRCCAQDDDFFDKALEGFAMFALNQGEVCTCPSRALIQESIYDRFMERALKRVGQIKQGDPLEPSDDDRRAGLERTDARRSFPTSTSAAGRRQGAGRRRAQRARRAIWTTASM